MKPLTELFGDFYSPMHILSYGKKWMISVGSRSIGKSTGWMMWLIYDYLKYGHRFIYLRRTDDEVKMTAPSCFDSAWYILRDSGYPVFSIRAYRGKFLLKRTKDADEEELGTYLALSQAYKLKSANFGDNGYRNILYDEFITTDPTRYLGSQKNRTYEYIKCDELYTTVDRRIGCPSMKETNFIFLANLATYYNPIFIGLGIDEYLRTDSKIVSPKSAKWIVEQTKSVKATESIEKSAYLQTSTEAMLDAYNSTNAAFLDNFNLVEKIKAPMTGLCNLKYKSHIMGVYRVGGEDLIYVCNRVNPYITLTMTADGLGMYNYALPKSVFGRDYFRMIREFFEIGKVRFADKKCQYEVSNFLLMMPLS